MLWLFGAVWFVIILQYLEIESFSSFQIKLGIISKLEICEILFQYKLEIKEFYLIMWINLRINSQRLIDYCIQTHEQYTIMFSIFKHNSRKWEFHLLWNPTSYSTRVLNRTISSVKIVRKTKIYIELQVSSPGIMFSSRFSHFLLDLNW